MDKETGKERRMEEGPLTQRLKRYARSDLYPFHMPGHKRQMRDIFAMDITEIHGFDDLHHAEGILKDSMEWAAKCYGSDESCYLVNGSTGGILSAVSGCVSKKGRILIGRNCHRSVYNGIYLNDLEAEYVYPQIMEGLGIQGGITAVDVEKKLSVHPDIQAVMIVSPTYDGIVSDVEKIAAVVHHYKIPLIVDEAHGAHFSFAGKGAFPVSALDKGADVVIQSLHKTLPCLTQTAILHMKERYLGKERMERIKGYLSVFQSSSPSYLFLAAIEDCILYMEQKGKGELERFSKRLEHFRERCKDFHSIYIPGREWIGRAGIYDIDLSKILLCTGHGKRNGIWLGRYLRSCHHLELEMKEAGYALALTSFCDREEGFERLLQGLLDADQMILSERKADRGGNKEAIRVKMIGKDSKKDIIKGIRKEDGQEIFQEQIMPDTACTIQRAKEEKWERCAVERSAGRVAADFVYLYPPGIPCLVPGEIITGKMIEKIKRYEEIGATVHGIRKIDGVQMINVLLCKDR